MSGRARSDRRPRKPTTTSRICEFLQARGDFASFSDIEAAGCGTAAQIRSALVHLRGRKAIDCIEEAGRLWWFETPWSDDRQRKLREVVDGVHKRPKRRRQSINPSSSSPSSGDNRNSAAAPAAAAQPTDRKATA